MGGMGGEDWRLPIAEYRPAVAKAMAGGAAWPEDFKLEIGLIVEVESEFGL
jgi:hypothetical protein